MWGVQKDSYPWRGNNCSAKDLRFWSEPYLCPAFHGRFHRNARVQLHVESSSRKVPNYVQVVTSEAIMNVRGYYCGGGPRVRAGPWKGVWSYFCSRFGFVPRGKDDCYRHFEPSIQASRNRICPRGLQIRHSGEHLIHTHFWWWHWNDSHLRSCIPDPTRGFFFFEKLSPVHNDPMGF